MAYYTHPQHQQGSHQAYQLLPQAYHHQPQHPPQPHQPQPHQQQYAMAYEPQPQQPAPQQYAQEYYPTQGQGGCYAQQQQGQGYAEYDGYEGYEGYEGYYAPKDQQPTQTYQPYTATYQSGAPQPQPAPHPASQPQQVQQEYRDPSYPQYALEPQQPLPPQPQLPPPAQYAPPPRPQTMMPLQPHQHSRSQPAPAQRNPQQSPSHPSSSSFDQQQQPQQQQQLGYGPPPSLSSILPSTNYAQLPAFHPHPNQQQQQYQPQSQPERAQTAAPYPRRPLPQPTPAPQAQAWQQPPSPGRSRAQGIASPTASYPPTYAPARGLSPSRSLPSAPAPVPQAAPLPASPSLPSGWARVPEETDELRSLWAEADVRAAASTPQPQLREAELASPRASLAMQLGRDPYASPTRTGASQAKPSPSRHQPSSSFSSTAAGGKHSPPSPSKDLSAASLAKRAGLLPRVEPDGRPTPPLIVKGKDGRFGLAAMRENKLRESAAAAGAGGYVQEKPLPRAEPASPTKRPNGIGIGSARPAPVPDGGFPPPPMHPARRGTSPARPAVGSPTSTSNPNFNTFASPGSNSNFSSSSGPASNFVGGHTSPSRPTISTFPSTSSMQTFASSSSGSGGFPTSPMRPGFPTSPVRPGPALPPPTSSYSYSGTTPRQSAQQSPTSPVKRTREIWERMDERHQRAHEARYGRPVTPRRGGSVDGRSGQGQQGQGQGPAQEQGGGQGQGQMQMQTQGQGQWQREGQPHGEQGRGPQEWESMRPTRGESLPQVPLVQQPQPQPQWQGDYFQQQTQSPPQPEPQPQFQQRQFQQAQQSQQPLPPTQSRPFSLPPGSFPSYPAPAPLPSPSSAPAPAPIQVQAPVPVSNTGLQLDSSVLRALGTPNLSGRPPMPPPRRSGTTPTIGGHQRMPSVGNVSLQNVTPGQGRRPLPTPAPRGERRGEDKENRAPEGMPAVSVPSVPSVKLPAEEPKDLPVINIPEEPARADVPMISLPDDPKPGVPRIHVPDEGPTISISEEDEHDHLPAPPQITVTTSPSINITSFTGPDASSSSLASSGSSAGASARHRAGLFCAGCGGGITGRIVSAMEKRWHPACFKCEKCGELLEHVSSFEHEGKAYCHLDYHEHFAPRCFHCETPIADSQFITLDDPSLPGGPRTYHELHFFCAECGDPFLDPSKATGAPRTGGGPKGDEEDEVGFTIWKGHPYCELCHVRLHLPKCKGCKKPIREVEPAVEVKRGKWHWSCFVCETCKKPFADGTFFERQDKAFCDGCYRILLRNEI